MIKTLIFDLSWTLLFPKDETYKGELNALHDRLSKENNYKFSDNFYLNSKTLDFIKNFKENYSVIIFTSGRIQNAPEINGVLKSVFENIYSAEDLKKSKSDPESYQLLIKKLNVKPEETVFVDDLKKNVEAANAIGINGIIFNDLDDLKIQFKKFDIQIGLGQH